MDLARLRVETREGGPERLARMDDIMHHDIHEMRTHDMRTHDLRYSAHVITHMLTLKLMV